MQNLWGKRKTAGKDAFFIFPRLNAFAGASQTTQIAARLCLMAHFLK